MAADPEGSPARGRPPLSAEDMVALATTLLPSFLTEPTGMVKHFHGWVSKSDMVGVAGWVRAARPDLQELADACTHGVALALLSLSYATQSDNARLIVEKEVGDAFLSEEAVAAFYATLHSNCVVRFLSIDGAAFGTPAAAAHLGRCLNHPTSLQELRIHSWGEAAWTAFSEALTSNVNVNASIQELIVRGSAHMSAALAAVCKLSALRRLWLSRGKVTAFGNGWEELLARALTTNLLCLEALHLREARMTSEGVKLLVSALKENHTLEHLDIGQNEGIGDQGAAYVAELLAANTSLKHLKMDGTGMGWSGASYLSAALALNTSLRGIDLSANRIGQQGMKMLLEPLTPDTDPAGLPPGSGEDEGSKKNTTLTAIKLNDMARVHFCLESMASMLKSNSSLTSLELKGSPLEPDEWVEHIIPALRQNATLEKLTVSFSQGVTATSVFEALFDLVISTNVSSRLDTIDVYATPLYNTAGLAERLEEELRVNREYRGKLKGQSTRPAMCGRLVLCGYAFSGKTTICNSMRRVVQATPASECVYSVKLAFKNFLRKHPGLRQCLYGEQASRELEGRTRGYDIVVLRNEEDRRTTMWDFAGQKEYYVLHDFMLPGARNTCFLFVCSAVYPDYHIPQQQAGKPKSQQDMEAEFLYWLRFLASNAKPACPPRVIFVLTNKDRLGTLFAQDRSGGWANNVVADMKEKFENVIHLEERAVLVNAQSSADIQPLVNLVEKRLEDLLVGGPEEFVVCEHVRRALQEWAAAHPSDPIIKMDQFEAICEQQVKPTMNAREYRGSNLAAADGRNAVLAYLNDAGEIIFPGTLDFFVVNPTWFGRGVLGSLIDAFRTTTELALGEGIQSKGLIGYLKGCLPGGGNDAYVWRGLNHQHGFVSYMDMEDLLETSLRTTHLKGVITPQDLIELMIGMEMCFKEKPEEDRSRLFVPAVFDDDDELAAKGRRQTAWKLLHPGYGSFQHVGRRLECENKALTFLSPSFFPRLQVVLRNYVHSKKWTENAAFQIDRNLLGFAQDGVEVLVEYSGDIDCFVDILAKSSQSHKRTLEFVKQHVIKRIRDFCASPQGCQGVVLVDAVIRPVCVEQLHLCADRMEEAVLVSLLEQKLTDDPDEKACIHTWKKQIEGIDTDDYALDLLEGKGSYDNFRKTFGVRPADTYHQILELLQTNIPSSAGAEDCYPDNNVTKGDKRGAMLLISMEKYESGDRSGASVDRGRLLNLADTLSLEVINLVDCTAANLLERLPMIAEDEDDIREADECFVCFVSAHGNTTKDGRHFITDQEGCQILLDDITRPFKTCKQLQGKPKVFFINSCRGSTKLVLDDPASDVWDPGSWVEQSSVQLMSELNEFRYVKDFSDCLIVFSTSGRSASARDPLNGTYFVKALVEAFTRKGHMTDVLGVICCVNNALGTTEDIEMEDDSGNVRKVVQCLTVVQTLTKKLCWK